MIVRFWKSLPGIGKIRGMVYLAGTIAKAEEDE
jgi:hypothetical protein